MDISKTITRRAAFLGAGALSIATVVPVVAAARATHADDAASTRVDRLCAELSEALDSYARGTFRAVVEPSSKSRMPVVLHNMRLAHQDEATLGFYKKEAAPALLELQSSLTLADAVRKRANDDTDSPLYEAAIVECWRILEAIADAPVNSLADLRIKASAFAWSAKLLDGEPYTNPSDGEEKIMRQIVGWLADGPLPERKVAA